jgi:hypothetical protein
VYFIEAQCLQTQALATKKEMPLTKKEQQGFFGQYKFSI